VALALAIGACQPAQEEASPAVPEAGAEEDEGIPPAEQMPEEDEELSGAGEAGFGEELGEAEEEAEELDLEEEAAPAEMEGAEETAEPDSDVVEGEAPPED
jgi:hypothetical protein